MQDLPEKKYYHLDDIATRWSLPVRDIEYYIENSHLTAHIRLYDTKLDFGEFQKNAEGKSYFVPGKIQSIDGLYSLMSKDCKKVFSKEKIRIFYLRDNQGNFCKVPYNKYITLKKQDIVISAESVKEFEETYALSSDDTYQDNSPTTYHSGDFTELKIKGYTYIFGSIQANVIKLLYEASQTDSPWLSGKRALYEAGSSTEKMYNLFKNHPAWGKLIISDKRGRYKLDLQT